MRKHGLILSPSTWISMDRSQRLCATQLSKFSSARKDDDIKYCIDLVKERDYEGYLAGLLYPKQYKDLFFSTRAYNIEIASIKDSTPRSNTAAARMRFQFWVDNLAKIRQTGTLSPSVNHPVAQALLYHTDKFGLNARWYERCLEVRMKDALSPGGFDSMVDLEDYAEWSHSSLIYAMLEAMEINSTDYEDVHFAASHVGVCAGIVTLLRGYNFHAQQGECYFPREVMLKHGLSLQVALHGPRSEADRTKLQDVVNDVASQAFAHLNRAREITRSQTKLPKFVKYGLISAAGSCSFLEQLHKSDFMPIGPPDNYLRYQMKLLYQVLSGKF